MAAKTEGQLVVDVDRLRGEVIDPALEATGKRKEYLEAAATWLRRAQQEIASADVTRQRQEARKPEA